MLPGGRTIRLSRLSGHLNAELDVSRLNDIHRYLRLAGRFDNIRALHQQILLHREIVITEKADLHLVWYDSRIFVKPLPAFLLNFEFFETNICNSVELYHNACGILWSYSKLIRHESDFRIAKEAKLLPMEVDISWKAWTRFFEEIDSQLNTPRFNDINKRYLFGELRLGRLNFICRFFRGNSRGYHYIYTEYSAVFRRNFAWLLLAFAFFTVILSAMQVAIGTAQGRELGALNVASYRFSVAVMVAVILSVFAVGLYFVMLLVDNLVASAKHWRHKKSDSKKLKKEEDKKV